MMRRSAPGIVTAAGLFLASSTSADIVLFDITGGEGDEWAAFLAQQGYISKGSYDLTAQFGDNNPITHGPLDLEDAAPKQVDSNLHPHGVGGRAGRGANSSSLAVFGKSAGFGNTETAIVANYFVDSFDILMNDEINVAAEFSAINFLGSNTVDVTVYATDDETPLGQFIALPAPPEGHRYGIASDDGTPIGRINIYDTGEGAEGIVGRGTFYTIPAPGALAFLGFAGLIRRHRRR